MAPHIHQFICLSDNFGVLVHDPETRATCAVDAPDGAPILAALAAREWELTDILLTHHHADHVQGVGALKAAFPKARVVGPLKEAEKIGGLDLKVGEGDLVMVGSLAARVIAVPGHTSGHVAYWFEEEDLAFVGDTLFAMGCGRAFEEPPDVLFHSLSKLAALPDETQVYCGHEYTLANAKFALSVEPGNTLLKERAGEVAALRAAGKFTLPTTISIELATNPFLRAEEPELQAAVGMPGADPAAVFAVLRERKNHA
ncbi:hydroxyacylglutathione hydrolase [Methylocella silvestris BL2]|uniref:Hydroxyacylglutathione hydrolase n=1 Tax=Methylocella silvestris (strain DSM 15510 / CIP 108128 / LMG 27833 / NCIMB 13906 / BL2) TaxID=395965 RepID=B8ENQ7_METSB|nr:hydroxyacylglutathione hydrolase [Methylocella silvestris]ACK50843.1 hydroxyacylglutathione hydrolase [Methylocella silvestris BL2]